MSATVITGYGWITQGAGRIAATVAREMLKVARPAFRLRYSNVDSRAATHELDDCHRNDLKTRSLALSCLLLRRSELRPACTCGSPDSLFACC